jgi:hypothetical protein
MTPKKLLSDNPNLGKSALVQLLTARFPKLNQAEVDSEHSLLQRERVAAEEQSSGALRGVA